MGKAAEKADEQEGAAVMAKNRIKISILGSDYIIASEEEENYVRQIAAETEKRIAGITRDNPRLSVTMAAGLARAPIICAPRSRTTWRIPLRPEWKRMKPEGKMKS